MESDEPLIYRVGMFFYVIGGGAFLLFVVSDFAEKPQASEGWISGGYFVFEPGVFDYLKDDATVLEREPLEHLARDGQLMAYKHEGFWMCMDTLRDKRALEAMWTAGKAPWKSW